MDRVLAARNIHAGYGDVVIVSDISVEVARGEIVAIVGPNGSGKSTLIKSLLGLAKLFGGQVFYHGRDITGISTDRAVNLGIGYVPQVNNVFPNLTVSENLEMGAYSRNGKASIKADMEEIYSMFPELKTRKSSLAENMSGGEKQMLAIARAMMAEPELLLLDEPLASLSPRPTSTIVSKLESIRKSGVAIMVVEQNVTKVLGFSDRGYVLVNGACVMEGDADSLFAEDSSMQRYLGLETRDIDTSTPSVHNVS